jgi:hypothetical protein
MEEGVGVICMHERQRGECASLYQKQKSHLNRSIIKHKGSRDSGVYNTPKNGMNQKTRGRKKQEIDKAAQPKCNSS